MRRFRENDGRALSVTGGGCDEAHDHIKAGMALMIPFQTTPVFHVKNLTKSLAYYTGVLGFKPVFSWGTPPFYAGVSYKSVVIHLNQAPDAKDRRGKGAVYIFVSSGVDRYYGKVVKAGAKIIGAPPQWYEYGLKDFKLADPDGNWLSFGEERPA
jgi:catechol 2,3-dioxygenase-like lactoylglutathione lyase family enzyme